MPDCTDQPYCHMAIDFCAEYSVLAMSLQVKVAAQACDRNKHSFYVQASVFTWFLVQTKSGELTPYNIRHTVKAMTEPPQESIVEQMCQLVEAVKEDYGRVDLAAMWRPYCRCNNPALISCISSDNT